MQVNLVRGQLRRAIEKYDGVLSSNRLSRSLSQQLDKDTDPLRSKNKIRGNLHIQNIGSIDHEVIERLECVPGTDYLKGYDLDLIIHKLDRRRNSPASSEICSLKNADVDDRENSNKRRSVDNKNLDSPVMPDDFLCPISLELMRDPVIVATGQVCSESRVPI